MLAGRVLACVLLTGGEAAQRARERGDAFGEAVALRDACRADASQCPAAKQAADAVIAKQLQAAEGPCASEPNACLAALEGLAPLAGAADSRLAPYFDRAGDLLAERCGRAPLQSPEDAMFIVRCAEAFRARVPTPGYAKRVAELREKAAAWVVADAARRPAEMAWLYASLAA